MWKNPEEKKKDIQSLTITLVSMMLGGIFFYVFSSEKTNSLLTGMILGAITSGVVRAKSMSSNDEVTIGPLTNTFFLNFYDEIFLNLCHAFRNPRLLFFWSWVLFTTGRTSFHLQHCRVNWRRNLDFTGNNSWRPGFQGKISHYGKLHCDDIDDIASLDRSLLFF